MAGTLRRGRVGNSRRMWSCVYCSYPISQRHHMLPVSIYGDTQNTLELCANCHEAFHIFANAYEDILVGKEDSRRITLMLTLRRYRQIRDQYYIERICMHVRMAYDQQHGTTTDRVWEDFFAAHDQREEERRWRLQ
jgi:hypothetical protein